MMKAKMRLLGDYLTNNNNIYILSRGFKEEQKGLLKVKKALRESLNTTNDEDVS